MNVARKGAREDRRRGDGRRGRGPARPRRIENAKHHPRRYALYSSRSGRYRRFLVVAAYSGSSGASRRRLRPRVRAGAADRYRAGARADPAGAGRRRRLVRVHGDAVRPDPPRASTSRSAVTTERKIWAGLRHEQGRRPRAVDGERTIELDALGEARRVRRDGVLAGGTERLSKFREQIEKSRHDDGRASQLQGERRGTRSRARAGSISLGDRPARRRLLLFLGARRSALLASPPTGWRSTYPVGMTSCFSPSEPPRSSTSSSSSWRSVTAGCGGGARRLPPSRRSAGRRSAVT